MDLGVWDTWVGLDWVDPTRAWSWTLCLYAGVDYEYKAVNLLKVEQSDLGGLVLLVQPYATIAWIWSVRLCRESRVDSQ
jgi:hypothetical protein